MVAGCALGTVICHWMFFFLNVSMVKGQRDGRSNCISSITGCSDND